MNNSTEVVIDANLVIYQVVETAYSEMAVRLFDIFQENQVSLYAPQLWIYEVTSVIHKIFFSGELLQVEAQAALRSAFQFSVNTVNEDEALCFSAFEWATRLRLKPAYDCFYLALAERLQADFWTADRNLVRAVQQPWVHWIGEIPL